MVCKSPTHRVILTVLLCAGLFALGDSAPASAASGDRVLILAGTITGGASSIEASEATAEGLAVDIVDAATWSSMTAAQFANYRAIILGDPTCQGIAADQQAAAANATTWGSVVNGNIVILGTDPVYHANQGGETVTRRGIDFSTNQVGKTGAYITLSCYYHGTPPHTAVPLLAGIASGGFTVTGVGCYNNAHIVAESPALTGLNDADLSNWSCSVHEAFDGWPGSLIPLAIAKDFDSSYTASDGSQGPPYILAGGDIRSFPLSLSPLAATGDLGGSHTITAQLLDGALRLPVSGAQIQFRIVAGPNSGAVGLCTPITCSTDAAGQVLYRYTSDGSAGTDTIQAFLDQNSNGIADKGEPQTTAGMTWAKTPGFKYVALGDSFSAGEGIEPFFEPKNKCHRSQLAYPTLVEEPGLYGSSIYNLSQSGVPGIHWGFQACSGATTEDVLTTRQWGDPLPQLAPDRGSDTGNANDLPVDSSTDLVTITIGGDDVHFSDVLRFCAFSNDCTAEPYHGQKLRDYATSQFALLGAHLDAVYAQIRKQAPTATILVPGYPQLLPATGAEQNCGKLAQRDYVRKNGYVVELRSLGFSQSEQNMFRELTSRLNQVIADHVERSGVATFVPVDTAFAGHEICGNRGEWINAPSYSVTSFKVNDQSFHPNSFGQSLGYAATINNLLNPRF